MKDEKIDRLKKIVLDSDFFSTDVGVKFKEMYGFGQVMAAISVAGRSKERKSFLLPASDDMYATHIYLDNQERVKVRVGDEDTDDFITLMKPSGVPADHFDEETLNDWIDMLTY